MEAPKPARAAAFRRSPMSRSQAESPTKSAEPRTRPAWMRQATSPSGGQQTCGCARHSTSLLHSTNDLWILFGDDVNRSPPEAQNLLVPTAEGLSGGWDEAPPGKAQAGHRRSAMFAPHTTCSGYCRLSDFQGAARWPLDGTHLSAGSRSSVASCWQVAGQWLQQSE